MMSQGEPSSARRARDVVRASIQTPAPAAHTSGASCWRQRGSEHARGEDANQTVRRLERVPLHADARLPDAIPGFARRPTFPEYLAAGASIDYYLASAVGSTVTLDILDSTNQVVRSFTQRNSDAPAATGRGRRGGGGAVRAADEGRHEPLRVGSAIRQADRPAPAPTWKATSAEAGRWWRLVLYKARLNAGGVTKTGSITVNIDPRVAKDGITVADLTEQTKFALKVRDALAEARQLAGRVRQAMEDKRGDQAALQAVVGSPDDETGEYKDQMFIDQLSNVGPVSAGRSEGGASATSASTQLMKEWASIKSDAEKAMQ